MMFHDVVDDDDGQLSLSDVDNDTMIDLLGTPVNATQSSIQNAPMTRPLTQFFSPPQDLKSSPAIPPMREITTYQAPNQVTHASSNASYSTHPTPAHTLSIPSYQQPPQQPYHQPPPTYQQAPPQHQPYHQPYHQPQQQPYHQHQHHPTLQQAHPPQQYQAMPQHAPPEPAYSAAFPSHARSLHPSYAQEPRRVTLSPPCPPHDGYHHQGQPPQAPYQAVQHPSYMAPPAPVYSNPHASVSMERRISYSTSPGPNQQPYVQSVHQQVQFSSQQAPPPQAQPSYYHQPPHGSYQGPQGRPSGPPANNNPYPRY